MSVEEARPLWSPRWWLLASIAFAVFVCTCAPIALGLFVLIAAESEVTATATILILFVLAGIPAILAALTASGLEWLLRKTGHPDRSRVLSLRTVLSLAIALSPIVILPVWFRTAEREVNLKTAKEIARIDAYYSRPIAPTDSSGFTSIPTWRMVDGLPEMKVAVRPFKTGPHRVTIWALDHANHRISGELERQLSSAVDTFTVRLRREDDSQDSTWWPVRVYNVWLEIPDSSKAVDVRSGDSLFVFDRTGLVKSVPQASPTAIPARP